MTSSLLDANKALVLKAFDSLFNRRDYHAAQQFWSDNYVQHSAHIAPGREGLLDLIRGCMVHGRFTGTGRPIPWIAVDILRLEDRRLAEHWDVLQDEATIDNSVSSLLMFGPHFPD